MCNMKCLSNMEYGILKSHSFLVKLATLAIALTLENFCQFYVDNPYRHTDKFLAENEHGEEVMGHTFDAPDKLCLVQVCVYVCLCVFVFVFVCVVTGHNF